ncbi:hypothetical protein [Pseudoalteromonas luteoviolacea]|uniref:Uncharacterized protein n=1 Tax=Pseudoalteromonas luteoviolacea NCIMB 1942 TaxID=1365253 RepID=A0A166Y8A5_9GAMM|nr:hypothetical protein [Pseudoalteromonas luteoviolacea]KZN41548.1 hypothetical protein N482_19925 [Pseudoalteromonas luteoviolacea NCIMB 1942]KZX00210.1 hypothetical protein JL49_12745 [Pseudoalteromonas luteoviolacea]
MNNLSQLHQQLCSSHGFLINQNNQEATKYLADKIPQFTKGVCYEYRAAELNHPCDFLVAYDTSEQTVKQLRALFSSIKQHQSQSINQFLDLYDQHRCLRDIQLIWLSFDWSKNHYPVIPTFYVSTQHYSYVQGEKLNDTVDYALSTLAPQSLKLGNALVRKLDWGKLNHIGFTFARESLKTKFTITLDCDKVLQQLKLLNWQGSFDKLTPIVDIASQLSKTIQISISFTDVLSKKIEVELPWVRQSSANYVDAEFINNVIRLCNGDTNYDRLSELTKWLENNPNNKAFYTKFSIFEDDSCNLKSYLHSSPQPKKRLFG